MRPVAAAIALALIWPGCSSTQPVESVRIEAGKAFSLKVGDSAQAVDTGLRVGFEAVTADSRCARGDRCVWAGDAGVRVWWQRGDGARQLRELHVVPGAAQSLRIGDRELRLLRLDPYPIAGKATVVADYVATLVLGPAPAGDPAR